MRVVDVVIYLLALLVVLYPIVLKKVATGDSIFQAMSRAFEDMFTIFLGCLLVGPFLLDKTIVNDRVELYHVSVTELSCFSVFLVLCLFCVASAASVIRTANANDVVVAYIWLIAATSLLAFERALSKSPHAEIEQLSVVALAVVSCRLALCRLLVYLADVRKEIRNRGSAVHESGKNDPV